ncbi:MAG: N-acetyl-alpha-D-glucosaminyl L-malate synthase BshA [Saprospirales bacterium]|nr:N-acetyl-alpha-D-glucosaminyl L-malate synthase BshA [Saprospirales bacterium]|tara:strand:+ start:14150 stop:15271 length:1122 start_codon:yes stop_codon:yes gene_type:complete
MKIGIVCYPTFGGSGVIATELGIALAMQGHEVHFITYSRPKRLNALLPNVYYHEVSFQNYALFQYPPYETALTSRLVDVALYHNLDLLHVHYAIPHASAAYFAQSILREKGKDLPFVTTLHGTDITLVGKAPSYQSVVEFSINSSNAVTAVSESLKQDTLDNFHINRSIEVIPNFIDVNRFDSAKKRHPRPAYLPEGVPVLVHASNFRKVKRVEDVLDVFYLVRQSNQAKLILIGDGPERVPMEVLGRQRGLDKDIIFLGNQDRVEDLLQWGDVFLLPSEKESFGLAALEAMASGLPVFSTNAGGLSEVNVHNETGYLVDVGDTTRLAEHVCEVIGNKTILSQLKIKAKARSQAFAKEVIVPQYLALYQRLIE